MGLVGRPVLLRLIGGAGYGEVGGHRIAGQVNAAGGVGADAVGNVRVGAAEVRAVVESVEAHPGAVEGSDESVATACVGRLDGITRSGEVLRHRVPRE